MNDEATTVGMFARCADVADRYYLLPPCSATHGETMGVRWFGVFSLTLILLAPLLSAAFSTPLVLNAQAADPCQGDTQAIEWNTTMQRMSEVPHYSTGYYPYYDDDVYYEDNEVQEKPVDSGEGPEEPWMYQQNSWNLPVLEPLDTSHYTTMLVGNDSVGALRLNLSANHRTTICVTLQDTNGAPVVGDVYLFTSTEYDAYVTSYECAHTSSWYCYGDGELEETLSNIAPEWRSWNPLGWKSYRDAHEYESITSVNLALNLDRPEVYTSLWGGTDWQDFYLVVDTWNNVHDADADAPGVTVAADVTLVTTPRSLILPSYTVALVFMAMLLGGLAAPFILNARYMKAGMGSEMPASGLVPSLERPADVPPFQHHQATLPPPSTPVPAHGSSSWAPAPPAQPEATDPLPVDSTMIVAPPAPAEFEKSYDDPFEV